MSSHTKHLPPEASSSRVLITGGAGFIGSRLVKKILETTSWGVCCLDNLNYSGNLNRLKQFVTDTSRLQIIHHDLRAELNATTRRLINDVDCVFHVAAKPHVDHAIQDPLSAVMHNVVGTCNILNYAREAGVPKFIYFSTDEVFGEAAPDQSFAEYARYNARNPYSASKAGGEELVNAFFHTYGLCAKVIHCNNVYGETQQAEAFIPLCIGRLLRGEQLTIHTDPTRTIIPTRKYIYVDDVAAAVLAVYAHSPDAEVYDGQRFIPKYNIVAAEEISILELAQRIAAAAGQELDYVLAPVRTGVDKRYSITGERLKQLGWQPQYTLDQTLPDVVQWFLCNPAWLK